VRIKITETLPGELSGNPAELLHKANQAVLAALEKATGMQSEDLVKNLPKGGELAVVDELAERMREVYERRTLLLVEALDKKMTEVLNSGD